jgi:hypothetical protein
MESQAAAVAAVAANSDGSGQIQIFTSVSSLVTQNPRKNKENPEVSSTDPFFIDPTRTIPEHLKRITKPCELLGAFLTCDNDW